MGETASSLLYLVAMVCFIVALRFLSSPRSARLGNLVGAAGMTIAIVVTLAQEGLENYLGIGVAMVIGSAVGVVGARSVKMTAMPQMVALFNGVGGGAVALISLVEFREGHDIALEALIPIVLAAIIGSISFWGSNVAFSKLQELSWAKRRFPAGPLERRVGRHRPRHGNGSAP